MDLLHNLALGFSVLADPMTIVYSLIGVVCSVIIGALPGLGPSVGIAVLLPCATDLIRPVPVHAVRDLLRGHVRWFHYLHPDQYAR
mgnify:CR=1 FL=1